MDIRDDRWTFFREPSEPTITDHPSRVRILLEQAIVEDLFRDLHDDCGDGYWCDACLEDVRREALLWLHELNVLPESEGPRVVPKVEVQPWDAHLLLASLHHDRRS
jgi:hypothetical protein